MMTIQSLWGELPAVQDTRTPKMILTEQAQALSDATKHILVGSVSTKGTDNDIVSHLSIVAPFLNNYRVSVLRTSQSVSEVYPVDVIDLINKINYGQRLESTNYSCNNEEEFNTALRKILQSDKVHRIITNLLTQSKDYDSVEVGSQDPA